MSFPARVVVIGGGVGGLATALRLAHAGHSVTVCEKNETIGGKLNIWEPDVPGVGQFRFDTGPHVLTMPWALQELFADIGERLEDHLHLLRIDPICRYHFADAPYFDAAADPALARGNVAARFPGDEDGFAALLRYARRVHEVTVDPFLRQDFNDAIHGIPTPAQWKQLTDFLSLTPWRTLHNHVARYVKHPKLRQIFDLYALYNGSSPYRASAIYTIIAHEQWVDGTYYLRGGLRTLATALETLARQKGVVFRTKTPVTQILFETAGAKPFAVGVQTTDGETIRADAVVCNSDPITTYAELVSEDFRPKEFRTANLEKLDPSTSAFLLLLGVRGTYEHLAHYNSFLPADSDAEFKAVFEDDIPAADPVIGVTCQSVTEFDCAPAGYSNLFVMASPPAMGKFVWTDESIADYRAKLIHLLETRCQMIHLSERIVCEQVWTPQTFAVCYGAWRGSLYGLSSNSWKNGFLRPPNRAKQIQGLYFVGGGTHPGGGLPLVTLGAKIVADAVCADQAKK